MIIKSMYVYCTTRFEWFHCWPDAPTTVGYLKNTHRHEFHVKASVEVDQDDRDVEFITLKHHVDNIIKTRKRYKKWTPNMSCEMLANDIGEALAKKKYKVCTVSVSEDGENGAVVIYE